MRGNKCLCTMHVHVAINRKLLPSHMYSILQNIIGHRAVNKRCKLQFVPLAGKVKDHSIGVSLVKDTLPMTSLSFPGKISTDKGGERLVVADTGHHRILVMNKEGIILNAIGGGEKHEAGFVDGSFQESRFHSPQGVAFDKEIIFVADTENHAIRQARNCQWAFLFLFLLVCYKYTFPELLSSAFDMTWHQNYSMYQVTVTEHLLQNN